MAKKSLKDMTGQVFGHLIVVEYAYNDGKNTYWRCQNILTMPKKHMKVFKIKKQKKEKRKMWEFENYNVYEEEEVLRFEDKDGNFLGNIAYNEYKEEILQNLGNGANPIAERWEDGVGNTITLEGWEEE